MSYNTNAVLSLNEEPRVALILVNFNCADDTLTCLRSIEALDYKNYELIVVDNNSSENAFDILHERIDALGGTFIRSPENAGFAAANNVGIHYALAASADYIWLLNPDTVVARDALSVLVERAEIANTPVLLGSKILYGDLEPEAALAAAAAGARRDGTEKIWSAGGAIDTEKRAVDMLGCGKADDGSFEAEKECEYLPGCSLFFSKEIASQKGMMRENFFMYFEETDWCLQLRKQGVRCLYVPGSVVWHRFVDAKLQGPRTVYYYNRNELYFWYEQLAFWPRIKFCLDVLLKKLPQARRALREAPSAELRSIFSAHVAANMDFLLGRRGRRASLA